MPKAGQPQSPAERDAALENLRRGREDTNHRGATQHGITPVINSDGAQLPAITGAAAIAGDVDAVLEQIVIDLGGDLSGAQKEILRSCRVPMIVLRLAEAYLLKNDLVDKRGRPRGLLKLIGTYSNALRNNLNALGLERKIRDAGDLKTYIAKKYSDEPNASEETQ